jgi:biotin carboxyl carrier protein
VKNFKVYVGDEVYDIGVEAAPGPPPAARTPAANTAPPHHAARQPAGPEPPADGRPASREIEIVAPMPGIVIQYEVEAGDRVIMDDPICILEAMKMENVITTPASGRVKTLNFKNGDRVPKDAVLAVIVT